MTSYSDELLRHVLTTVRTIAVVGASPNPARPSHRVAVYLARCGYRVFAVNPGHNGSTIAGLPAFGRLADIPDPIDMVDVFRSSEHLAGVVEEALALSPRPKVIWSQLGVVDEGAAARAEAEGVTMIMDRCPAIERPRLL
jgi:predicted CoA-binding protein